MNIIFCTLYYIFGFVPEILTCICERMRNQKQQNTSSYNSQQIFRAKFSTERDLVKIRTSFPPRFILMQLLARSASERLEDSRIIKRPIFRVNQHANIDQKCSFKVTSVCIALAENLQLAGAE